MPLNGLTTLSDEAADALARHEGKGEVNPQAFPIDKPLTVDRALTWATLLQGDLSRVIAIDSPDSVAVAKALAGRKGPLKLPNLWRISPKANQLESLDERNLDVFLLQQGGERVWSWNRRRWIAHSSQRFQCASNWAFSVPLRQTDVLPVCLLPRDRQGTTQCAAGRGGPIMERVSHAAGSKYVVPYRAVKAEPTR